MARANVRSVDDYIEAQPEGARATLRRVRDAVRKAVPGALETICYGMPAYKVDGVAAIYFAAWKRHYSLYPVTAAVSATLADVASAHEVENGTVRFPLDADVPVRLIARIARVRAAEAAERARKKSARRPPSTRR